MSMSKRETQNTAPADRAQTAFSVLAGTVLVAGICQVGIGARFTETGEQIGLALPLSTLVLALALLAILFLDWPPRLPSPGRFQVLFLSFIAVGFLGLPANQAKTGIKELLQVLEMAVLGAYLFERLARRDGRRRIAHAFGWAGMLLLVIGATGLANHPWIRLSDAKLATMVIIAWPFMMLLLSEWSARTRLVVLALTMAGVGLTVKHGGLLIGWFVVMAITHLRQKTVAMKWMAPAAVLAGLLTLVPLFGRENPWHALNPNHDREHLTRPAIEALAALQAPRYFPLGGGLGRYKPVINELRQYQPYIPHAADLKIPRDGNNQYLLTMVEAGIPAAVLLALLLLAGALSRPRDDNLDHAAFHGACRTACIGALIAGCWCVLVSRGLCIWMGALIGLSNAARPPRHIATRIVSLLLPAACIAAALAAMLHFNHQADPVGETSTLNRMVRRHLFAETGLEAAGLRIVHLPDTLADDRSEKTIEVEAETFTRLTAPFTLVSDNGASGHKAVAIPQDKGKGIGSAVYEVTVPVEGFYILYARVYWQDGCSNSLLFDTGGTRMMLAGDMFNRWHTLETRKPVRLARGTATITVKNIEDGVRLDYFGLRRVPPPASQLR